MKRLFCIVLLLYSIVAKAQTLDGLYEGDAQSLRFNGDSVVFNLHTHSCLINVYKGKGTYHIVKNRLFIDPVLNNNPQFLVSTVANRDMSKVYYKVVSPDLAGTLHKVIGASVFIMRNGKFISGRATDINGFAKFSRGEILATDSIRIAFIGFFTAKLKPVTPNSDLDITLYEGNNDEYYLAYLSNRGKGYPIKLAPSAVNINFEKQSSCGKDLWIEFKKQEKAL